MITRFLLAIISIIWGYSSLFGQGQPLFAKKIYVSPINKDTCRYRLLPPLNMEAGKKYPLVVFFHGAGERGRDNEKQLTVGVHRFALPEMRKQYPCFVLAPQCPMKTRWVQTEFTAPAHTMDSLPTRALGIAMETVLDFIKNNPVDTSRIYVMGISMGGFATWEVMARYPNLFAAAVPISGGADEKTAETVKHIPVWVFHGGVDAVVKTSRSRNMVAALKQAGAQPIYTEYAGVNHNCWGATFSTQEMYKWLFEKRKK
jgi:predicted peptidase